jgi:hypothetical protein
MAKKTVGKVNKKRPGQGLAARNAKLAGAEYSGVESVQFDLKSLVASVKSAQSAKTQAKQKNTDAKVEVQQLRLEETQLQTQTLTEDTAATKESATDLEKSNRELRQRLAATRKAAKAKVKSEAGPSAAESKAAEDVRLFGVMVGIYENAELLSAKQVTYLASFYDKALSSVTALPAGFSSRLALFRQLMDLARRFRRLKVTKKADQTQAPEKEEKEKPNPKDKLLGDRGKKIPPWKTLTKALSLVGGKASKVTGTARTVGSTVSASASMLAVKSIAKVSDGLKFVGRQIKQNGTDTMKWVGGKLSELTSRVMGMLRSAKNFLTGGGAADFLSMGAIALGVLPTLIDGLVSELKARFGDNFVMGFISEKWDATKKFVTEFLSDFIDKAITMIKNLPETLKNLGGKAWEATEEGASKASGWVADKATKAWDWLRGEDPKPEPKKPISKEDPSFKFQNLLNDYDTATSQSQKDGLAVRLIQLVNSTPLLKSDPKITTYLKNRGININAKVNNATNTSTTTANAAPAASGRGGSNTTTVSAPTSNTNVSVTPPPSPGGDAPVVAEKPVPSPGGGGGGADDAGSSTPTVSNGLNNASVPNNAADEGLIFMNIASMGA